MKPRGEQQQQQQTTEYKYCTITEDAQLKMYTREQERMKQTKANESRINNCEWMYSHTPAASNIAHYAFGGLAHVGEIDRESHWRKREGKKERNKI